jgi:hypothetical protein
MTIRVFACITCRHYDRDSWQPTCTAFPEGIPDVVLVEGNPHTLPLPGDHGVGWEPKPDAPADVRAANHPFPWVREQG